MVCKRLFEPPIHQLAGSKIVHVKAAGMVDEVRHSFVAVPRKGVGERFLVKHIEPVRVDTMRFQRIPHRGNLLRAGRYSEISCGDGWRVSV